MSIPSNTDIRVIVMKVNDEQKLKASRFRNY